MPKRNDSLPKVSLGLRICIFLGIVLLMAGKPELLQSVSIVASSLVLGLLSPLAFWRSRTLLSTLSG